MSRIVGEAPAELPCARCKKIKLVAEFPVRLARGKPSYWSYCTRCANDYARDFRAKDVEESRRKANAYYAENAVHKREMARQWRTTTGYSRKELLRRLYGLTLEEYQVLLSKQHGVCAICSEPPRGKRRFLAVDHDHETGAVRGLLCTTCNVGLGALRDSPVLVQAALTYLEQGSILAVAER
jgi:hypothetical protein